MKVLSHFCQQANTSYSNLAVKNKVYFPDVFNVYRHKHKFNILIYHTGGNGKTYRGKIGAFETTVK